MDIINDNPTKLNITIEVREKLTYIKFSNEKVNKEYILEAGDSFKLSIDSPSGIQLVP